MKKKLAVVLTALMMLSTSTVFLAAGSPASGNVVSETTGVTVDKSETTKEVAKEKVVEVVKGAKAETTEVVAVVELNGTVPADGKVTLSVDGIKDGDNVVVLHYYDGAWVERPASVVNGKVVADFSGATHFSPVVIAKVAANTANNSGATLPKTGAVAVLPIAAMACAAGAVACRRKEK